MALFTHPLTDISRASIEAAIDELDRCDRAAESIEELRKRVRKLMEGYSCMTRTISSLHAWRARRSDAARPVSHVRELWYPPVDRVRTYGRLNRPGHPMLYLGASMDIAVLEMRPIIGDVFTILKLRLKDAGTHPHVMELGLVEKNSQHGLSSSVHLLEFTGRGQKFLGDQVEKNLLIRSFLAREFLRVVKRGDEHEFKLSVAIAEELLKSDEIDGVEYPTLAGDPAKFAGGANLALKPASADRLYEADVCSIWKVEDKVSEPKDGFRLRCIKRSKSIAPDGQIDW